jgi:hypothetical protein
LLAVDSGGLFENAPSVGEIVNAERSQISNLRKTELSRLFKLFNCHDEVRQKSVAASHLGLSSNPKGQLTRCRGCFGISSAGSGDHGLYFRIKEAAGFSRPDRR